MLLRCSPGLSAFVTMTRRDSLSVLEEKLGYRFRRKALLTTALTHRSFTVGKEVENNEKLEFLGDAVLDLAVSDLLMEHFPDCNEGDLSKMRAALVNAQVLAYKAETLSLGAWLRLGKGEEKSGGRQKVSILAAVYEAFIGAVYMDGGFSAARAVVATQFASELEGESPTALSDYKTRLQEITQKIFKETPVYTLVQETGPDHDKKFVSQITIAGKTFGRGEGRSKKSAEQAAAMQAIEALKRESEG